MKTLHLYTTTTTTTTTKTKTTTTTTTSTSSSKFKFGDPENSKYSQAVQKCQNFGSNFFLPEIYSLEDLNNLQEIMKNAGNVKSWKELLHTKVGKMVKASFNLIFVKFALPPSPTLSPP